jgi:hypothetical protein
LEDEPILEETAFEQEVEVSQVGGDEGVESVGDESASF